MAVSYDLVLEERIIARAAARRVSRPFAQEVAEMVRHAVGYRSRAFVTFGEPIPMSEYDPDARRDLVRLTHRVHDAIGLLYKVLPTALVAAAMRRPMSRSELVDRVDELIALLAAEGANLAVHSGARAVDEGLELLTERAVVLPERERIRVRDRVVLRYYARTIAHLLNRRRTTH
jgi:glycerol-3-phosphate O-acyltransferase